MKLAFAIAAVTAAVTRADCNFGSNYTTSTYFNSSDYCSFDVGFGLIRNFSETNIISSGDINVTTYTTRGTKIAVWKVGDKESTVQCYSGGGEIVTTSYPNESTFSVNTGDFFYYLSNLANNTVADGVPLFSHGLYYFQGGRAEYWSDKDGNFNITDAEGDITDLCEVLGGGAASAPTPTPPTTEAPSSGQVAAVTIIPCVAAVILNYFFS